MDGNGWILDFPAVPKRRAERQLLFEADVRRSPEGHQTATEAGLEAKLQDIKSL